MNLKIFLISLIFISNSALTKELDDTPPLPYLTWGECIGEKCYVTGEWNVLRAVTVFKKRDTKSGIIFKLKKGESVIATKTVIVTSKPGITKVTKPLKLWVYDVRKNKDFELQLDKNEVLYELHDASEGYSKYWYKGRTFIALPDEDKMKVISYPQYEWWVKLKHPNGKEGWSPERETIIDSGAA